MNIEKKHEIERVDPALQNILDGGEATLKVIYREHRKEFIAWSNNYYNIPEHDAIDIFQDAIIVFYKNVLRGKIRRLDSSIKTYIFGIGKNMIKKHGQKQQKLILVEDMNDPLLKNIDWGIQHELILNPRSELIKEALNELTAVCMKILKLVYYKRFVMEVVKERMGYKSEEVARTSKKKCMRKLEIILKQKMAKAEF